MTLYRLDASIRVEGSHSRAIADIVEQEWRNVHPGESVVRRHVGVDPIPATAWATAVFAGRTPEKSRTDEQQAALALAGMVARLAPRLPRLPRPCLRRPEGWSRVPPLSQLSHRRGDCVERIIWLI